MRGAGVRRLLPRRASTARTTVCATVRRKASCYVAVARLVRGAALRRRCRPSSSTRRTSTRSSHGAIAIVRGRFAPKTYARLGNLGRFIVTEAWVAESDAVSDGVFAQGARQRHPLHRGAVPDASTEKGLNTSRIGEHRRASTGRWRASTRSRDRGLRDRAVRRSTASIIAGDRYTFNENGRTAKGRTATAAFHVSSTRSRASSAAARADLLDQEGVIRRASGAEYACYRTRPASASDGTAVDATPELDACLGNELTVVLGREYGPRAMRRCTGASRWLACGRAMRRPGGRSCRRERRRCATPVGSGGGDGSATEQVYVYAHTASTLYRVDPDTLADHDGRRLRLGLGRHRDQMTDIAIDKNGEMIGISYTRVYRVDPTTAQTTLLSSSLGGTFNGLSFVPAAHARPDRRRRARRHAQLRRPGVPHRSDDRRGDAGRQHGRAFTSSGDLVAVDGLRHGADRARRVGDMLAQLAPQTFAATADRQRHRLRSDLGRRVLEGQGLRLHRDRPVRR